MNYLQGVNYFKTLIRISLYESQTYEQNTKIIKNQSHYIN
jgi:hypothetical protein